MSAPTEESFTLDTPDGKKIYGLLNRATQPSGKAIILSHGLTGHPGEYIHIMARNFFTQHGYDVIRFSYYAEQADARKLIECTILTHAEDLALVCNHFRQTHGQLYVAGHSYGGLSLLYANPPATAFAFWDSSYLLYEGFWKRMIKELPNTSFYIIGWGSYHLINPAMVALDKSTTVEELNALAAKITTPSLVVLSEESRDNPSRTPLFPALNCTKKATMIDGANHVFTNGDTARDLLQTTLEWFDVH